MTDNSIEALLEAWAAWLAMRWRPARCGSAEGLYLRPRVADDDQRKVEPRPFTLQELERVERAICRMPRPYGSFIKLVWVLHKHPCTAARRAGLWPSTLDAWPEHRSQAFTLLRRELVA